MALKEGKRQIYLSRPTVKANMFVMCQKDRNKWRFRVTLIRDDSGIVQKTYTNVSMLQCDIEHNMQNISDDIKKQKFVMYILK